MQSIGWILAQMPDKVNLGIYDSEKAAMDDGKLPYYNCLIRLCSTDYGEGGFHI